MTSAEGSRIPRARVSLRGWLLVGLVALVSCAVIAMHSLGAGHLGTGPAISHDSGSTASAGPVVEGVTPTGGTTDCDPGPAHAASVAHHAQVCQQCAVTAAPDPDHSGGHAGLSMCLAVLSLLVWVALRSRRQALRTVHALARASRFPFTELVRGPPRRRAPSLSELCICRT